MKVRIERIQPRCLRFRPAVTALMVQPRAGKFSVRATCSNARCVRDSGRRTTARAMTQLDCFLAYSKSHRLTVCVIAALWISLIAWWDSLLPDVSIGFLYLFPILFSAAALNNPQILGVALLC